MQKVKVFFTLLFGLMLSSICLANTAQENFKAATKYVDPNGESYSYTNLVGIEKLVNETLPATIRIFIQDDPQALAVANPVIKAGLNLLNVSAFKAVASSSVEVEKGLYVTKNFTLFDRKAKSIFIDPNPVNAPLNLADLPADTRIAIKLNLNLANVWNLFKKEIDATPWKKEFSEIIQDHELNLVLNNFHGDIELLVTGTTLQDLAVKAVVPDKGGHIAALIKKHAGNDIKDNTLEIPIEGDFKITVMLSPGKIIAYSSPKILDLPEKTIASKPIYQKIAKNLPKFGTDYIVLDIPQETIDFLKLVFKDTPEVIQLIDLFLKPVSVVCVARAEKDGYFSVTASNFSFAQAGQVLQSGVCVIPIAAGMLLPALNSARDRGRVANCLNDLKQLGLAINLYSCDNNDFIPQDMKALVKGAYIQPKVVENLVYVGPYERTKITQINTPSQYVIAICRSNKDGHHEATTLNVLFLDGHVVTHKISQPPVDFLRETYKLSDKDVERITKRLAEKQ